MKLSTVLPALVAASVSALPEQLEKRATTIAANRKLAMGTSVVSASGTVNVPEFSAKVPLASVTASVNSYGNVGSAQVVLQPLGPSGPGLCAARNVKSTFTDSVGNNYIAQCGVNPFGQGDLASLAPFTWDGCVEACRSLFLCQAVVFDNDQSRCYFKNIYSLPNVTLSYQSNVNFAWLDNILQWKKIYYADSNAASAAKPAPSGPTTTQVVPATGAISVPGATRSGIVADATVSVVAETTLAVKIMVRWP